MFSPILLIILITKIILCNPLLDMLTSMYSHIVLFSFILKLSLHIFCIPIFFLSEMKGSVNLRNCNFLILSARTNSLKANRPAANSLPFSFSLIPLNDSRIECPL